MSLLFLRRRAGVRFFENLSPLSGLVFTRPIAFHWQRQRLGLAVHEAVQVISAVDMNETRVTARAGSDFPRAITFGLFVTTQICS